MKQIKTATNKAKARRYYLHGKIKKFTTINSWSRQIQVSDELIERLDEQEKAWLFELRDMGYNLQYFIE